MIIPVGTRIKLNKRAYENWPTLAAYKVSYGIRTDSPCVDLYDVYNEQGELIYDRWYLNSSEIDYCESVKTAKDWL